MKYYKALFLVLIVSAVSVNAQEISFDKKSGDFKAGETVVANLKSEKVKGGIGKNYLLMDAAGVNELMAYRLHKWEDTFGGPTQFYYTIHCKPLGYEAFRPNLEELNSFKEVGNIVVSNKFLQPDGKLNEAAVKEYFQAQIADHGNYDQRHLVINDSLMKLVNIPAPITERNMRKPITANEYGKIGQDNKVIGFWELVESKKPGIGENKYYMFQIRNTEGGIVCISHIELSGAHTYVFKNGVRSKENWQVVDLVNNNPLTNMQNQQNYVIQLSQSLVRAGLL